MDRVREIARAVLYEGYLLWPYRRSALKNRQRWTFGCVYPEAYGRARGGGDPWTIQTQCLLEGDAGGTVDVEVRFLHVVERRVARLRGGELEAVDQLTVGDQRHLTWEEATERQVGVTGLTVAALLDAPDVTPVDVAAGEATEWLADPSGQRVGALVRRWQGLRGRVETSAERAGRGLVRLTVSVANTTPWSGERRDEALRHSLVSAHTVLHTDGGRFVSLTDPPARLRGHAQACHNAGAWPVLVGEEGERHTLLSAPIVLYDYPKVAPESPGDLFDATEIDQLLTLSVLSLSEEERQEAEDGDPRARELLRRCAGLAPEQLMRLHGALRDVRTLPGAPEGPPP